MATHRFPTEPWRLVETEYSVDDLGQTETLFALGNGYLGMRANPEEGRSADSHGTYLNGFHETWRIRHAENAYGFAEVGQTIVNVPDAKLIKLYVDDEPLLLSTADLDSYERSLDFRTGVLSRELIWRTAGGKRVKVTSRRMTSFVDRHLALMTFEVTVLDASAPVVISSQMLNRQDGRDEYNVPGAALGEGTDPRRAQRFTHRVLQSELAHLLGHDGALLGYRCTNSHMTMACAYQHLVTTNCEFSASSEVSDDIAKTDVVVRALPNEPITITKFVAYHSSSGVPATELAERCLRTLERAVEDGVESVLAWHRAWLNDAWLLADVELDGDERAQQAMRWNIFQLLQATASTHEQGVAAKGVTSGGYDGHYFWDTEIYVIPFLAYSNPDAARRLLRFRWNMLDAARRRAAMLSEQGALYPWRTINGEEASAYYAAGTAQYHINGAVVYALRRYLDATGDVDFLAYEGAEMLIETARMWGGLGFYATNGDGTFHIHGVTGPDEYTTVVNDNCYTNIMARFNLRYATHTIRFLREWNIEAFEAVQRRTNLDLAELDTWDAAADAMHIPYDVEQEIHPQDSEFLNLEPWDWVRTPPNKFPLLLHFHPLVIYRHRVLKQADVVLAMYLRREHFTVEQKRRNFDYYDPITSGDSSLSACVQSIMAAEVGHDELALDYFHRALYLDLCDTHDNTADGVHIASCGGVWAAVVHGFAGMDDNGDAVRFAPRLPASWNKVSFQLRRHGSTIRVEIDHRGALVTLVGGVGVPVRTGDTTTVCTADESIWIAAND
jgi:alpha,alpha-trehalose phosphorylase